MHPERASVASLVPTSAPNNLFPYIYSYLLPVLAITSWVFAPKIKTGLHYKMRAF